MENMIPTECQSEERKKVQVKPENNLQDNISSKISSSEAASKF